MRRLASIGLLAFLCGARSVAQDKGHAQCPHCGVALTESELDGSRVLMPVEARNEPAPVPHDSSSAIGAVLATAIPSLVLLGGVLVWFLVVLPRRRRRPFIEALELLERDDPSKFADIERLLGIALTTGLRAADVAEARFAVAYVRGRLGRFGEAEALLSDMETAAALGPEAAYLKLWILARQRKHDEVETLYDRHAGFLSDVLDAKRLAGISFLHLGRKYLSLRATETALGYFDRVRELGVLADQIPADLGNHHVVFALTALFGKNWAEARKHFEAARAAAPAQGEGLPSVRLGPPLCSWCEDADADVDAELSECMPALVAAHAAGPKPADEQNGKARGEDKAKPAPSDEAEVLLAGCRLWHLFSLLRAWRLRPARTPLGAADRNELAARCLAVKEIAPDSPEPWLVEGLIDYYFGEGDPAAREAALRSLQEAVEREMSVPEVLFLLEHEREQERIKREGPSTYLKLLKHYLTSVDAPADLRRELRDRLAQHAAYRSLADIELSNAEHDVAPSDELSLRAQLMLKRVLEVQPRLGAAASSRGRQAVDPLMTAILEGTKDIGERGRRLAETEQRLMILFAEDLIREEEPPIELEV